MKSKSKKQKFSSVKALLKADREGNRVVRQTGQKVHKSKKGLR